MAALLRWLAGGGAPGSSEAAALETLLRNADGKLHVQVALSLVASAPGAPLAAPLERRFSCALPPPGGGACVASLGDMAALLALLAKAEPEVSLRAQLEELVACSVAAAAVASRERDAACSRSERAAAAAEARRALERAEADDAAASAAAAAARVELINAAASVVHDDMRRRTRSSAFISSCDDDDDDAHECYAHDGGPAFDDGQPRLSSCTTSLTPPPSPPPLPPVHVTPWRDATRTSSESSTSPVHVTPRRRSRCGFMYDAHMAAWHAPRCCPRVVAAGAGGVSERDERPERVLAVHAALTASGALAAATHLAPCALLPAGGSPEQLRSDAALLRSVHAPAYLAKLGLPFLDADGPEDAWSASTALRRLPTLGMYATASTPAAARLAAGCVVEAVERVLSGDVATAFALVRPPGHHASCAAAGGFCWLNNTALGARAALAAGARRVAIVDWDVHHGGGTQDAFLDDARVLYASLHRHGPGVAPGSGAAHEAGVGAGEGFTLNVPFPDSALQHADYAAAFHWLLLPVLRAFAPDIILVSAGFDAAAGDPAGGCCLTPGAFAAMTRALMRVRGNDAADGGGPRVVTVLEGGCHLESLARCADAMFRAQLQFTDGERESSGDDDDAYEAAPPPVCALRPATCGALRAVCAVHARHWPVLAQREGAFRDWAEGKSDSSSRETPCDDGDDDGE
jgi:acetoin utilization deacetylase AcuC-like enzyme